ncbi:hypothetical protein B0H16DRAFT_1829447 [Mycena metata]|uniref:MYND-type domain-containing protein n=1 Tax=Mycena metata TaxID=1033252 RepID=A0AAD7M6J0_9AGAR|nr:hypothetical protein B0H16DRAFT_1829447 [Mycena metata]
MASCPDPTTHRSKSYLHNSGELQAISWADFQVNRGRTVRRDKQYPSANAGEAGLSRVLGNSVSSRDRGETARQAATSISAPLSSPAVPTPRRANQHHTPYPGAPRVPAATTPAPVRARRPTAAADTAVSVPPPPTITVPPIIPPPQTMPPPPAPRTARESRGAEDRHHAHVHVHAHAHPTGPYRDEDVLLSLQLLAYLSKYPHVRQAFYKRRHGFHPASALALAAAEAQPPTEVALPKAPELSREREREKGRASQGQGQQLAFLRAFGVSGGGKEKEKGKAPVGASPSTSRVAAAVTTTIPTPAASTSKTTSGSGWRRMYRSAESAAKLPQEIQYWAGMIMRNACRKDDSRGGIRQCANMLCGRWEEYPREFAKCRWCRKAKYCGKECQSTAWSEGHRFWCSAKEGDDAPDSNNNNAAAASAMPNMATSTSNATITPDAPDPNAIVPVGAERRDRRERYAARERERLAAAIAANAVLGANPNATRTTAADAATVRGFRSGILGAHPNTVSAVFGGTPSPTSPTNAAAGPSREHTTAAPVSPPAYSTRSHAMALLRRTADPLGAVGSPDTRPSPWAAVQVRLAARKFNSARTCARVAGRALDARFALLGEGLVGRAGDPTHTQATAMLHFIPSIISILLICFLFKLLPRISETIALVVPKKQVARGVPSTPPALTDVPESRSGADNGDETVLGRLPSLRLTSNQPLAADAVVAS